MPAVTLAEKTINKRSPVFTGIANPEVVPLLIVPIESTPVSGGANATEALGTGTNILVEGAADLYNCAVIVIVEPTRLSPKVVLK